MRVVKREVAAPTADASAEIARLNKIIRVLMDRAESSASASDFSLFQTAILLEEQVRRRTAELEAALRENEKITRALRESEARFRGLVSQSLAGIAIVENGRFSYTNPRFDEMFGYAAGEMQCIGPLELSAESDPTDREALAELLAGRTGQVVRVFRALRKDGSPIDVEIHGNAMAAGAGTAVIALVIDVTERTRAERELRELQALLREQSTRDPLTGLHNRRYLEESLARELVLAAREGHPVSVVMGDIDHFKAVNDRWGHPAGDAVLRVFGTLMKARVRGSDIVCRYGGEEFLIVLPRMTREGAVLCAERLRESLAAADIVHGSASITVTASFGVASFPHNAADAETLIDAADRALYAAKKGGRNRVSVAGDAG